jgi:hypothetical protein
MGVLPVTVFPGAAATLFAEQSRNGVGWGGRGFCRGLWQLPSALRICACLLHIDRCPAQHSTVAAIGIAESADLSNQLHRVLATHTGHSFHHIRRAAEYVLQSRRSQH